MAGKHFEKIMTKAELDEYLAGGTGYIHQLLGVTRVHFYPFDYGYTDEEQALVDLVNYEKKLDDADKYDLQEAIKAAENFIELQYSTVYKGIRFYFDNGEDLKRFCEIVENGHTATEKE